jgi:hypothetical protein
LEFTYENQLPTLEEMRYLLRWDLHRSEQYLTSSQFFSHFLRQVKGRSQVRQVFSGKCCFFTPFIQEKQKGSNVVWSVWTWNFFLSKISTAS